MGIFTRYGQLKNNLEIQMSNNKILNDQNIKLGKENSDYQLQLIQARIDIEDLKSFREQDKETIEALKKERASLKRKNTTLEKKGV